jgi:hypothetical protein
LALAKDLIDDLEAVDLNEIDGEFYWRMCRDDLLGPLSQLAESIAPHIVDPARRNEQLDEAQQQVIDEVRQRMDDNVHGGIDYGGGKQLLDWFMKDLKARELFAAGQPFAHQLPRFVWHHYKEGRRIPMRAPMTITPLGQGIALALRVWSRRVTGQDIDAFIWSDPPNYFVAPYIDSDFFPVPPGVDDRTAPKTEPRPISQASLQIHFDLITELPASLRAKPPSDREEPPFIQITVRTPLPPPSVIGFAYDAIVRKQHQWHQELLGSDTVQDKEVAIRTWATGLLLRDGLSFREASFAVQAHTNRTGVSQNRFQQDRTRLIERVPEAEPYLFQNVRPSQVTSLTNP